MTIKDPKTLTRMELSLAVYEVVPQLSREQSHKIVHEFLDEIVTALSEGEEVTLRGFGKFKIQHKSQRLGRNPKTGKDAIITARRSVKFSPSPMLNARVNGHDATSEGED